MSEKQQERRRYFRVMDNIGLRVNVITDDELDGVASHDLQTPAQRLVKVNRAINKNLAALKKQDESLATLLGLLNHKMDLLAVNLEENSPITNLDPEHSFRKCEANISACGIAFPYHVDMPKAQNLSLHIKLYPSEEVIHVVAAVVGCERRDAFSADLSDADQNLLKETPYWVRANFEDISVVEQELLAQHVIQKQASGLSSTRRARGQSAQDV